MIGLFLLVRIGGQSVALPTLNVGSVVEIEEIEPVPRVAPHVAGLFALRSRVLTVIDAKAALGLGRYASEEGRTAAIVTCHGHSYALQVDEVEDVVEAGPVEPCAAVLADGWAQAALGTIRCGEAPVLVLDPMVLVAGCRTAAA